MLTRNDLLVLGMLLERPMHGYEIIQALKSDKIELWFEISAASVYYSLNKLHRKNLITDTRRHQESGEKTIYHVTESGREEFFIGMDALIGSTEPIHTEYNLGIFMLNRLPQERALTLLKKRQAFLEQWTADLEQMSYEEISDALQQTIIHHAIEVSQLEVEWVGRIIQQLEDEEDCDATKHNLMVIQGDFSDFYLPDLLKLIVAGKHSGTLTVQTENSVRTLSFENGEPICVSCTLADEIYGPERALDCIYDLFRWQQGAFTFDQRGCPKEGCVMIDASIEDLLLAGARKLDNWTTIQRIIPSSHTVFEHRSESQDLGDHITLREDEERVLTAVDGLKDVTALAQVCQLTEFETSQILYGLYIVGLIESADLDKARLRRAFREFAELMCRSTTPYRPHPDDLTCEKEVNRRCTDLPLRLVNGRIEDQTASNLSIEALVEIYKSFLQTQQAVLLDHFGQEITDQAHQAVMNQVNPTLREILDRYDLI